MKRKDVAEPRLRFVDLSAEAFEPGGRLDSQRPRVGRALRALARNSGALEETGADGLITVDFIAGDAESDLSRDGADFLDALFWLMTLAGYGEKVRAFACVVIAMAARSEVEEEKSGGLALINDKRLAYRLGISERTVQRRRAKYKEEAARLRFPILHIIEGDYDSRAKKNRPTLYGSLVNEVCARIIQVARGSSLWGRSSRVAMREAAEQVYFDIETAPDAVRRRRRRTRSIDEEIETIKRTIRTKLERWRELERKKRGGKAPDQLTLWATMQGELQQGETAAASGTGRQIVAPSSADIVVEKDPSITSLLARQKQGAA